MIGTLLLCLFVLACAVYPAVDAPQPYTTIMLVCCAVVYLAVVRSVLPALAALVLSVIGGMVLGPGGGTLTLCLLCAVTIGAYLICTVRSWLLVAVPVLAYALALIIGGDALLSLLALITFPAAGILAYAIMKNSGRVGTVCATSTAFGLLSLFGLALVWYRNHGTVSWNELVTLLTDVRDQLIVTLQQSEQLAALQQSYDELNMGTSIDVAALVRTVIETLFTLLPATAITFCNLLGYAAQLSCTHAFVGTGMKQLMTRTSQLFILSVPSAIVFLICTVTMLFSSVETLGGAVVANLFFILLPAMCLVGLFKLIADVRQRLSPLLIVLCVAALIFAPHFLVLGLALSGAATTLLRPLITRLMLSAHHQNKDE